VNYQSGIRRHEIMYEIMLIAVILLAVLSVVLARELVLLRKYDEELNEQIEEASNLDWGKEED